jgi:hypothetical protein
MASLRPSAFNQRERADGGPFLVIASAEPENEGVNVFFTDVAPEQWTLDSRMELLLHVCPDRITIWPLNVRADRDDYLKPKYDTLERIVVSRPEANPYVVPASTDDVIKLLAQLPEGFAKDFRFGLGLLWEYRQICETTAAISGVRVLIIHKGNEAKIDLPFFMLGITRFHSLRKELNRITSRYQREARKEKQFQTYQALLHVADAKQFPAIKKKVRSDAIAEITNGGRDHANLSKNDRRAVVRMVQDNVGALAETESNALLALKSDIELVTLNQLIERYQEMLGKELAEGRWQSFFLENPFILSLAFAVPTLLVQGQAYAGGKRLNGSGGKIADFLYASATTGNLALVEIKRPGTELLGKNSYRGDLFAPSTDLGAAIVQVLDQRFKLQNELPVIKNNMNRYDIHSYAIRCIVIAGKTPPEHSQKKSFELVRNTLSDVIVVTFDELLQRLIEIKKALQPTEPEPCVPF